MNRPEYLIFDLGGVLIELQGVTQLLEWSGLKMTEDEMWTKWLGSPGVRAFERGQSSAEAFSLAMAAEFKLKVSAKQFLEAFVHWPKGPYPGVPELLERLYHEYKLITLSNTNLLHWETLSASLNLKKFTVDNFPSHQTGLVKPDKEVFLNVLNRLSCAPDKVVYFDDNQLNVDGAQSADMPAFKVNGIDELKAKLAQLEIG